MNYLAHAYLSFSPGQIVGNLLVDFARHKDRRSYPREVEKGIVLHHAIDSYTDTHLEIRKAKLLFSPLVGRYSGAMVDVVLDYFLANDPARGNEASWKAFTHKVYQTLETHKEFLPPALLTALPRMQQGDWLYNSRYKENIEKALQHLVHRAKYLPIGTDVYKVFLENESTLQAHYTAFFPQLEAFVKNLEATLN